MEAMHQCRTQASVCDVFVPQDRRAISKFICCLFAFQFVKSEIIYRTNMYVLMY